MVSLGIQTAFFFIFFLRTAISYAVSLNQGAYLLPGLASGGGGDSLAKALLVDIPAMELCTLVPEPGTRTRALGGFGALSLLSFNLLGVMARSIVDLTSESELEELEARIREPANAAPDLLRAREREVLAPWRRASKVKRKCGALSMARLAGRVACGETGAGVGSREGGSGRALSLVFMILIRWA